MYRNDTVLPFFGILFGVALWYMAYLDGVHIQNLLGHTPEELSVGQLGLITFGIVFFLYGAIGYISAFLEGSELRPGRHEAEGGVAPVILTIVLTLILVALSGVFVNAIAYGLTEGPVKSSFLGQLAAGIFLIMALLLVIYKKHFVDDEVLAEDEHSEVPW